MIASHIIHAVTTERDYYIAQVGRTLEIRACDTHAVLDIIEPPAEWGNNWLWSCCEFDGARCVAGNVIRLIRTTAQGVRDEKNSSPKEEEQSGPPPSGVKAESAGKQLTCNQEALSSEALAALNDWHNDFHTAGYTFSDQRSGLAAWQPLQLA